MKKKIFQTIFNSIFINTKTKEGNYIIHKCCGLFLRYNKDLYAVKLLYLKIIKSLFFIQGFTFLHLKNILFFRDFMIPYRKFIVLSIPRMPVVKSQGVNVELSSLKSKFTSGSFQKIYLTSDISVFTSIG